MLQFCLTRTDGTTYEYDNAGNLVRVVGAGKTALYVYNADNKLVKATVQQGNNVVVETYTYDYAGNRTSKTTTINNHVEKVYYLNDNSSLTNVLVECSANGDEICYYTIGADLVSQEINGKVYAYLYDGHGTVRALANESGKLTDTYTYDAFGNLLNSTGTTANNYRYCGEQFDSTTGLYYLRARYMDTSTGRFISLDSYEGSNDDPISLHKYLYANSNPVTYTDPSGYFSLGEMAGVMAISGIIGGMSCGAMNVFRFLWDKSYEGNATNWLDAFLEGYKEGLIFGLLFGGAFYLLSLLGLGQALVFALSGTGFLSSYYSAYKNAKSGNTGGAFIDLIQGNLCLWTFLNSCFNLPKSGLKSITEASSKGNGNYEGKTPAQRLSEALSSNNKSFVKNNKINTVAVIRTADGKYIWAYNSEGVTNTSVNKMLSQIKLSKFAGQCAEINAIAKAYNMNIDLNGASISVANVRGITSQNFGSVKAPCNTCQEVIDLLNLLLNLGG